MSAIVSEILTLMTSGLTTIGGAIGGGLTDMVEGIFIDTSTASSPKLTTFGAIICIFAGVSLAFGLVRWTLGFVTSLGNRNR